MIVKDLLVLLAPDAGDGGGTLLTGEQLTEGNQSNDNNTQVQTNNREEGSVPGWLSGVAEEYRDTLKEYQKPTDFVKEALTWKEKSSQSIVKPKEDATAEEVAAYRQAMGIPENADKYELPESELMGEDFVKAQKELYLKSNLSADQAKAVHESLIKQMSEGVKTIERMNKEAREEAERTLKSELNDAYEKTLQDARMALKRFATEGDIAYLTKTGLGNDAGLIKMFANIQNSIGGDSLLATQSNQGQPDEVKSRFPNSPEMYR